MKLLYIFRVYTHLLIFILNFRCHAVWFLHKFMSVFSVRLCSTYWNHKCSKSEYALVGIGFFPLFLMLVKQRGKNGLIPYFAGLWPSLFLLFGVCCLNYYLESLALCWHGEIPLLFCISYYFSPLLTTNSPTFKGIYECLYLALLLCKSWDSWVVAIFLPALCHYIPVWNRYLSYWSSL